MNSLSNVSVIPGFLKSQYNRISPHFKNPYLGNRTILWMGSALLLGVVIALIRYISSKNPSTTPIKPWKPRDCTTEKAIQKMWKNAEKAINEHGTQENLKAFATTKEALPALNQLLNPQSQQPLTFFTGESTAQSYRDAMEDAHYISDWDQGLLVGVCDGHGGPEVARYISQQFPQRFQNTLNEKKTVFHAFEYLIDTVAHEVLENTQFDTEGSTAVCCFIDRKTRLIYTPTVGDSKAVILRVIDGQYKAIPLSCERNWASKKDAQRAVSALGSHLNHFKNNVHPKALRYPDRKEGINLSRTIGDKWVMDREFFREVTQSTTALTHKPKITINQTHPGDIIIVACDGLFDYVLQVDINEIVSQKKSASCSEIAEALVKDATARMNTNVNDNVTVVVIKID